MTSLDQIAIECGTDKSSKGHNYCQYYEMFFSSIRELPNNLLEIGVDKGDSIKMWQQYFPITRIYGIDLRGDYEYLLDSRTSTHIVDQSNRGELIIFARQFPDEHFNIIIDDGSHQSEDQILTFETLFPYLQSGGYYIIEDLLCVYDARWNSGRNVIERIMQMVGEVNMNGKIPNDHICANKKEAVKKYKADYFEKNIEWTFNACGMTVIKKL
jgi:hypothetical protein